MKRIYTLIILLSIAVLGVSAQVSEVFDNYSDTEGVTSVYISKSLLKMMPDLKTEGMEIKGLLDKLDSINIITTEDKTIAGKIMNAMNKALKNSTYEDLLRVNEDKEKTRIYMKSDKNNLNEYLIINDGADSFNAIRITGRITPADVQNIVK